MNTYPTVSVNLVCYNHEAYLAQALDSILAQTYSNVEIRIFDDCSTDGTSSIIRDYAARFPDRIFDHSSPHNIGFADNCIRAIQGGDSEYICVISGDDIMLPTKIERQLSVMMAAPDVGLCYHDVAYFHDNPDICHAKHSERVRPSVNFDSIATINPVGAPSNMIRRSCLDTRLLPRDIPYSLDWIMWLVIGRKHQVLYIPEVLFLYRVHPTSYSNTERTHRARHVQDDILKAYDWLIGHADMSTRQKRVLAGGLKLKSVYFNLKNRCYGVGLSRLFTALFDPYFYKALYFGVLSRLKPKS